MQKERSVMRKTISLLMILALACTALTLVLTHPGAPLLAQQRKAAPRDAWLQGIPSGKTLVVDMTYAINDKLPAWPGDDRVFEAKVNATVEKNGYFTRSFWMLEHYGPHMDAHAHFPPGNIPLDKIPEMHFFGPAVVVDGREEAAKDADYRLRVMRVEEWEAQHGRIMPGSIVLL